MARTHQLPGLIKVSRFINETNDRIRYSEMNFISQRSCVWKWKKSLVRIHFLKNPSNMASMSSSEYSITVPCESGIPRIMADNSDERKKQEISSSILISCNAVFVYPHGKNETLAIFIHGRIIAALFIGQTGNINQKGFISCGHQPRERYQSGNAITFYFRAMD